MFEREVAIYRRLQERGVQVSFVTFGDGSDLRYADRIPGIRGLSSQLYERWLRHNAFVMHKNRHNCNY